MAQQHSHNKILTLATAIAVSLHGMVGAGLISMPVLKMDTPKTIPPIQIELLTISSEPPKPEPKPEPKLESKPEPKPIPKAEPAPAKPKMSEPTPKPALAPKQSFEPVKPEAKPKTVLDKPVFEPKPAEKPADIKPVVDTQAQQKEFEIEQERIKQEKQAELDRIAKEKQAEADRIAKEKQIEADRIAKQAELDRIAKEKQIEADRIAKEKQAEADRIAKEKEQTNGSGNSSSTTGKDKDNSNGKDGGKNDGKDGGKNDGVLTGQDLSSLVSNASWKNPPNYAGITSEKLSGQTVTLRLTLTISADGKITNVAGVKTGDTALDKQISQAVRRARFHAFKNNQGQVLSGTAYWTLVLNIP